VAIVASVTQTMRIKCPLQQAGLILSLLDIQVVSKESYYASLLVKWTSCELTVEENPQCWLSGAFERAPRSELPKIAFGITPGCRTREIGKVYGMAPSPVCNYPRSDLVIVEARLLAWRATSCSVRVLIHIP